MRGGEAGVMPRPRNGPPAISIAGGPCCCLELELVELAVQDLIGLFVEMDPDLIVELNGRFVFAQDYAATRVAPNDRVEFIHPNFGG